jgi:hypothetical protein
LKRTAAEGTDLYGLDAVAGMNVEMLDNVDVEGGFGDLDGGWILQLIQILQMSRRPSAKHRY